MQMVWVFSDSAKFWSLRKSWWNFMSMKVNVSTVKDSIRGWIQDSSVGVINLIQLIMDTVHHKDMTTD